MTSSKKSLEEAEKKIEEFESQVKQLKIDPAASIPIEETEKQTKLSSKEMRNANDIYLKPKRIIYPPPHPKTGVAEKFNEAFRKEFEYLSENVRFIAEHKEIIGESIPIWTRPFGGMPAEEWEVPVNKPVWGPRYLKEQIARKCYTRLVMEDRPTSSDGTGTYYGQMVAKNRIHRLDAYKAEDEVQISFHRKAHGF